MKAFPFAVLVLGACSVGDPGPQESPDAPLEGGTSEERLCTTEFSLSGTFTLGMSPPDRVTNDTGEAPADGIPDIQGCWPVGTWSFSLTQTANDCELAPTPPATVSFRVGFVADAVEPAYTEELLSPQIDKSALRRVHVSQGGGGKCEGIVELFSQDGREVFNLHPTLDTFNQNGVLGGQGEFGRFTANQLPNKCGDGIVQDGEQCDDGNEVATDGCSTTCKII